MKHILEDIKKQAFARTYLLYGEESYLRQEYVKRLVDAMVSEGDTMNYSRLVGDKVTAAEVIDLSETFPFLAEKRVILLEDTVFFKKANEETQLLADYLGKIPEHVVLIFNEKTADKRTRLYKALSKSGRVAEFARLKPERLQQWVVEYLKHAGRTIGQSQAQTILLQTGDDMGTLRQEMEKLIAYTEGRDVITAEDITDITTVSYKDKVFELFRVMVKGEQKKALQMYYELLSLKISAMMTLSLMVRHFSQLLRAKELEESRLSSKEMGELIGVNPYFVKGILQEAASFTEEELKLAVSESLSAEEAVKTGHIDGTLALELLIVQYSSRNNRKAPGQA
ncbi:MAG: DNA polymerase III subunit delta [Blautia sp.]|nr:DNA polymerase III subunit delta [Blautia sp.]